MQLEILEAHVLQFSRYDIAAGAVAERQHPNRSHLILQVVPEVLEAGLEHLPPSEPVVILLHLRKYPFKGLGEFRCRESYFGDVAVLYPRVPQRRVYRIRREVHLEFPFGESLLVRRVDYLVILDQRRACVMPVPNPQYVHVTTKQAISSHEVFQRVQSVLYRLLRRGDEFRSIDRTFLLAAGQRVVILRSKCLLGAG